MRFDHNPFNFASLPFLPRVGSRPAIFRVGNVQSDDPCDPRLRRIAGRLPTPPSLFQVKLESHCRQTNRGRRRPQPSQVECGKDVTDHPGVPRARGLRAGGQSPAEGASGVGVGFNGEAITRRGAGVPNPRGVGVALPAKPVLLVLPNNCEGGG